MGWPVLALCFEACWFGELSQQPIRPHSAHLRRCSHQPPVAKQSTQPVPVGFAVGLIPSLKLHALSCLICTQTDCCSIYLCGIRFANITQYRYYHQIQLMWLYFLVLAPQWSHRLVEPIRVLLYMLLFQ